MIAYDRYTELLGKIIYKTITPAEQKDVDEFEAAHRITEAANLVLQKEIARHRQTEAVLALSEARFSQIVASIEDVIYSVDSENREFNYVSPSSSGCWATRWTMSPAWAVVKNFSPK